jgi:acetyl esterase/lipase
VRPGGTGLRLLIALLLAAGPALTASGQPPLTFDSLARLPATPPDHRIAYGSGPLQFGHLRLPRGTGPHPVVVFLHGGCFLSQYTISHVAALEQALAEAGYAVWSIEYRRVGDEGGGWPGTFEDVGRAADFVRELAGRYPLDLRRVVAAGHSAGGNFALWLPTRHRLRPESPLRVQRPLEVAAVLALTPAPDLAAVHARGVCDNVVDKLMGGPPDRVPERYGDVSPVMRMPVGVPQVVIVGGQDRNWGPYGRAYHSLAVAAGDTLVRLVDVPASGHFDVVAPTTGTWGLVMEALRDLFARIDRRAP